MGATMLKKSDILKTLQLLSALEVIGLMREKPMPDYLLDQLNEVVGVLSKELLGATND
jgi:hypothetical protein